MRGGGASLGAKTTFQGRIRVTETRQWLLNGHPRGRPINDDDLKLVTTTLPEPGPGQMLLKTHYLGFDPAQKGWMENIADYVAPMAIGDVMRGSGITEVVASNGGKFPVGTMLSGSIVWSEYLIHDGEGLIPCMPELPPTAMLSILGTTGVTAYCGLFKVGEPVAGDVVVVSGAAGATGSIVGQLAKIAGCTVIGIAGGPEKCKRLVERYGFDVAIDYRGKSVDQLSAEIAAAAPQGVNVIFENVGGDILDAGLNNLAMYARIGVCGLISEYNNAGEKTGARNIWQLIVKRASMTGLLVADYVPRFGEGIAAMAGWITEGKLVFDEHIDDGIDNALPAFLRLFSGSNDGKMILKLS